MSRYDVYVDSITIKPAGLIHFTFTDGSSKVVDWGELAELLLSRELKATGKPPSGVIVPKIKTRESVAEAWSKPIKKKTMRKSDERISR